ncbi:MAG: aldo/keto reductase [Acidobacteriia bacterium]|nr:aldo/keto reductase [Terriglobia bacterium]
MRTVAIIQARTASTRLPGKALLPVAGFPSAVLAALRLRNRAGDVLVATSGDPSDDRLALELQRHAIRVFRGPLEDVLRRYRLATADLPDECVVVRLTADNVVPDGELLEELAAAFVTSGLEYLTEASPQSRLPYGVGGEAFSVKTLRQADAAATSPHDREHVGPWIKRNCRSGFFVPPALGNSDFSHLRCTIDDEEDYQRVLRLFQGIADPLQIGFLDLVKRLAGLPGEPSFRVPYRICSGRVHSEMTLGTAQLGFEYGIVNRTGMPSPSEAATILRQAIAHGVTAIDTARAYGKAERVLADALSGAWKSRVEIITKLDPSASVSPDAPASKVTAAVDASLKESCEALGTAELQTVLLHRAHHYEAWGGAAWQRLLEWCEKGKIGAIGVSVYEPREALHVLRDPALRHLQVPMNLLDWRWRQSGIKEVLAERPDVVVHARSALLQGLLVNAAEYWPACGDFDPSLCVQRLRDFAARFERRSVADLCLAYVRSQPWITSVVVGCETRPQLQEDLDLFRLPKLSEEQCHELERGLPVAPEVLLNPSQWSHRHERTAV